MCNLQILSVLDLVKHTTWTAAPQTRPVATFRDLRKRRFALNVKRDGEAGNGARNDWIHRTLPAGTVKSLRRLSAFWFSFFYFDGPIVCGEKPFEIGDICEHICGSRKSPAALGEKHLIALLWTP